MKKRGALDFTYGQLLSAILVLLVVVVVAGFFIFKGNIINWVQNFPDYKVPEDEIVDISDLPEAQRGIFCENLVGLIQEDDDSDKSLIYLYGEKTNLYIDSEANLLKELLLYQGKLGKDVRIGRVDESEEKDFVLVDSIFMDEKNVEFIKYKDELPSIDDLKWLHESYLVSGSVICKSNDQIVEDDVRSCEMKCNFFGSCKNFVGQGEISLGELDCRNNEVCAIKEVEEVLSDGDLALIRAEIWRGGSKELDLFRVEELDIRVGDNKRLSYFVESQNPFCYNVGTDNFVFVNGYAEKRTEHPNIGLTHPAGAKIFWITAWDPVGTAKVVKRVKLVSLAGTGGSILDKNFKKQVVQMSVPGESFVIENIFFKWSEKNFWQDFTSHYKITKLKSNEVRISVVVDPRGDRSKWVWHNLDCDGKPFEGALNIYKIEKESLTENLLEFCEW